MKVRALNHVAIHTRKLEESQAFYRDVLGLPSKERPAFDFPGAWFDLGEGRELHLLGGMDFDVVSHSRGAHFALEVESIEEAEQSLIEKGVEIAQGPQERPDGAHQIFVVDPDGYWVELCDLRGAG